MEIIKYVYFFKFEMQRLGYVDREVDAFIHDFLGDRTIAELSDEEGHEFLEYLEAYLSFARKSKQMVMQH